MDSNYPDQDFLTQINLQLPQFSRARSLLKEKRIHEAALSIAETIFEKPRRKHPFQETDIPYIAKFLNKISPTQIRDLQQYADNCLMQTTPKKPRNISQEYFKVRYLSATRTQKERASGAYILIRLYHLTGKTKYQKAFYQLFQDAVTKLVEYPKGIRPGGLSWHPKAGQTSGHDPAHIAEEMILAFPFFRNTLTNTQKLFFLKFFVKTADFLYRAITHDTPFNIPFHFITSCHLIATTFPEFKESSFWKQWARQRILDDYTGAYNVTKDSYFREGVGYQIVVHNLLLKNLIFWKNDLGHAPKSLLKVSEKSFEFATKIIRLDGTFPLLADTVSYAAHERHIAYHELLHLAATFFDRPDFLNYAGNPHKQEPREILFWDMGKEGIEKWKKSTIKPFAKRTFQNHHLNDSRLQILGQGTLQNGHSGIMTYANNINHAHFDVGSIDIWGLGRPLLTDPGMSTYQPVSVMMDTRDRSHNMSLLSRLRPLGPRLDLNTHNRTTQIINEKKISGATFTNTLYECHLVTRTLCLIKPTSQPQDSFWIVLDTIKRKTPWPSRSEPYELAESHFHFNAPDSVLGVDIENFTVWSKHTGKNFMMQQYRGEDICLTGTHTMINFHNQLKALEGADSNANLQITAIPNLADEHHYDFNMQTYTSYTCQYGGRVKRPAVSYLYNGYLPLTIPYILLPFRGVREKAFANITSAYYKNHIEIFIKTSKILQQIIIRKAASEKPQITSNPY